MTLGEKIIFLRKEQNLTQNELAEQLYVSRNAISKWETNNGYPNIDNILAISKIFCVTLDELIGEENLHILEKNNHQKYLLFGLINLLVFLILNGLIYELSPKNSSVDIAIIIISLRFLLMIILFYVEVVVLRRKFLSRKQKKITFRIDILMIFFFLVVIVSSIVMILLSMQT